LRREPGFGADWTAMPQFFKEHGWYAAGGGKVYHPSRPPNNDMPKSWDVYAPTIKCATLYC
jgi:iduronate 2-sulfatase